MGLLSSEESTIIGRFRVRGLLSVSALLAFLLHPQAAEAGPILTAINAVSLWLTTTLGATLGGFVWNLGVSVLLSAVSRALQGRPKQQRVLLDLLQPSSQPVWRFVYGKGWAPGTPAPVRVKGSVLYCCYILNSRQSAGPFEVYLDKRLVVAAGDPYDFSGPGATATNDPFGGGLCKYWIGRGGQTTPPAQFLTEAPEIFLATDGWQGSTVIWMRLDAGDNSTLRKRWPSAPPEVFVDGYWSMVRDPRDPESPPAWSANQALCTLDALREFPLRPYDDRHLWLETFCWAADVADAGIPTKSGVNIPIETNGVVVFSDESELEDQINPLVLAGACRLTRTGGRLGMIPAVYVPPSVTLRDVLADEPMVFDRYRPGSEMVTEVYATYTSPARRYEDASTPVYVIEGAQEEDGGVRKSANYDLGLVTDYRQAEFVAFVLGRRTRMQRSISAVWPAEAVDLVAGSGVTVDLPDLFSSRNGSYEVEEIHPGGDPVGQSGFAMRCPAVFRENSEWVYAWDPELHEMDVVVGDFDPEISGVSPPGEVARLSDASTVLTSGDVSIARVRFSFAESSSTTVVGYEWHYRVDGGLWLSGGFIGTEVTDGDGDVFGYVSPAVIGSEYVVRVRAAAPGGASEWVESLPVTASAGAYLSPAPAPVSAIGSTDSITVVFLAPNSGDYRSMYVYGADVDDAGASTLVEGPVFGAPNSTATVVESGLGAAQTRYYFARSLDRNGGMSPFSASVSGTTS